MSKPFSYGIEGNTLNEKDTSAIRMIAIAVYEQHSQVHQAELVNVRRQVEQLTQVVKELSEKVQSVSTQVAVLRRFERNQREDQ